MKKEALGNQSPYVGREGSKIGQRPQTAGGGKVS